MRTWRTCRIQHAKMRIVDHTCVAEPRVTPLGSPAMTGTGTLMPAVDAGRTCGHAASDIGICVGKGPVKGTFGTAARTRAGWPAGKAKVLLDGEAP